MIVIIRKSIAILFFILEITSCAAQATDNKEKVNKPIFQEWIVEEPFKRISVSKGITLHLLADKHQKIQVQADKNLLECITMEVNDHLLFISTNCAIDTPYKILVHIQLPTVEYIKASKNSTVYALNTIKGERLQLKSSHGSRVNIAAHVEHLDLESAHHSLLFVKGKTKAYTTKSKKGGIIEIIDLDHPVDGDNNKNSSTPPHFNVTKASISKYN